MTSLSSPRSHTDPINKLQRYLKTNALLWLRNESAAGHSGSVPSDHMFPVFIVLVFKKAKTAVRRKIRTIKPSKKPWIKPPLFQRMMKYRMNLPTTWSINSPGLYLDEKSAALRSACDPPVYQTEMGSTRWDREIEFVSLIHTFFNACINV